MELIPSFLITVGLAYATPSVSKDEQIEDEAPRSRRRRKRSVYIERPLEYTEASSGHVRSLLHPHQRLKRFHVPLCPESWFFVGVTKSGKTVALRSIFKCYASVSYFKHGIAFSMTAQTSGDLDFLPTKHIHFPDPELLDRHITGIRYLAYYYAKKKWGPPPPNFIIFDDCQSLLGGRSSSELLLNFMGNFRWPNCSVFWLFQRYTGAATMCRDNSQKI